MQRKQSFAAGKVGEKRSIKLLILFVPHHCMLKIRLNFEEGLKFRIIGTEEIVEDGITDQYHLGLQRDRFRFQTNR